jgi:hypothetical protein
VIFSPVPVQARPNYQYEQHAHEFFVILDRHRVEMEDHARTYQSARSDLVIRHQEQMRDYWTRSRYPDSWNAAADAASSIGPRITPYSVGLGLDLSTCSDFPSASSSQHMYSPPQQSRGVRQMSARQQQHYANVFNQAGQGTPTTWNSSPHSHPHYNTLHGLPSAVANGVVSPTSHSQNRLSNNTSTAGGASTDNHTSESR